MIVGKHSWQQEEEQKGDISTALMIQEQFFISELFKDIQDAILMILHQRTLIIQSGFFQHIYHIGCAFNLHSVINSGLILGGQNSSKRQTVLFLPFDLGDRSHKDPEKIDLSVPRRAHCLHNAWKRHQDAVFWVDVNLSIRKGSTFCQTRSNAIIFQETLPAYGIPKVFRMKTGEVLNEKAKHHFDHHQRSHYVTIGRKNWARKLIDSQKKKLLDKQNSSNQPNQFRIQFMIRLPPKISLKH